jgi:alanyl-tRNA synthetase
MKASEVRKTFLDFFQSKNHEIVSSSPMVVKDDPTLMFINAGMNQFKDIFLGNKPAKFPRAADTQKCLRVSGKHNDLEEVGRDTYHHTMFEMLGNWSFGDYFKKEAVEWAWELLTEVYKINKENLYVTVFGGDKDENLDVDNEAFELWKKIIPESRILYGSKKDNFWEMGETGPCGPCSEIHIDIRNDEEKTKIPGKELVNKDHPQVIEIWNLVFMEFNRMANGTLVSLPAKHVDTGMGFERLCMVLQNKQSNYDTDVFQPLIQKISKIVEIPYGKNEQTDIAMRVIADHTRAITFAITDGQLPSNTGAGYVIRRILRRAVRYAYTFLDQKDPMIYKLIDTLAGQFIDIFPEVEKQKEIITKVIMEEETSFLRTLANGIQRFNQYLESNADDKIIDGAFAFELFDTYGFPLDLTALIAEEHQKSVDEEEFQKRLLQQKERSRKAASINTDDWVILDEKDAKEEFIGYDHTEANVHITRYRKVTAKNKTMYQLVFNYTPFYAESGGQIGDTGYIEADGKKTYIIDTRKENDLIIHFSKEMPTDPKANFHAVVNRERRENIKRNHTATHLLHHALRNVLGEHVEQKGSFVGPDYLRFDFSHFGKMTPEEIKQVEHIVNTEIRENHPLNEKRAIPMEEARDMGALAFFGEKYGDLVRVINFGDSTELCGGTHVTATGNIGIIKITSEGAIAAGIRRIEALTGTKAEEYLYNMTDTVMQAKAILKNQKDIVKGIEMLQEANHELQKEIEILKKEKAAHVRKNILSQVIETEKYTLLATEVELDASTMKDLAFQLKGQISNYVIVLGTKADGKAGLLVMIDEDTVKVNQLNAGAIIRELAVEIKGGGGGQPHFASAGGKNPDGIPAAIEKAKQLLA